MQGRFDSGIIKSQSTEPHNMININVVAEFEPDMRGRSSSKGLFISRVARQFLNIIVERVVGNPSLWVRVIDMVKYSGDATPLPFIMFSYVGMRIIVVRK